MPAYDGCSLANIPVTILSLFGAEVAGRSALPHELIENHADGVNKVVLLVADAMGYGQLLSVMRAERDLPLNKLAERGSFVPLTSTFPSTTTVALTSLHTGVTPQEHGMMGYRMYLSELGVLADMITLSPAWEKQPERLLEMGLKPKRFLGVKTVYQRLTEVGVNSYIFIKNTYKGSGLSKLYHIGAENVVPFFTSSDMFVQLRRLLESNAGERMYICVYWDAIDAIAHRYGPETDEVVAEVRSMSYTLETELLRRLKPDIARETMLMVTSDHGQIHVQERDAIRVTKYPTLTQNLLMPPSGDYRAAYLYVKQGHSTLLKTYLSSKFREQFVVLDSARAFSSGLFGNGIPKPEAQSRIGDLIVIARKHCALYYPHAKQYTPGGRHGGMSPDEMLIPFFCAKCRG